MIVLTGKVVLHALLLSDGWNGTVKVWNDIRCRGKPPTVVTSLRCFDNAPLTSLEMLMIFPVFFAATFNGMIRFVHVARQTLVTNASLNNSPKQLGTMTLPKQDFSNFFGSFTNRSRSLFSLSVD